jgi:hypothetical protein
MKDGIYETIMLAYGVKTHGTPEIGESPPRRLLGNRLFRSHILTVRGRAVCKHVGDQKHCVRHIHNAIAVGVSHAVRIIAVARRCAMCENVGD